MDTTYSTIISLLPFDLIESKPGLHPNEYIIHKAEGDKIGLTIIPNNVFYLINPDPLADAKDVRNIQVPVKSIELAQSIIVDYSNALLGVSPPDAMPGLVAVKGDYSNRTEVSKEFIKEIMIARNAQNNWFENLVNIADDTWAKTRSPMGISDLQRSAAKLLGRKRDWINPTPAELIMNSCPICKATINEGALKCVACGTILNKKAYDEAMLALK